MTKKEFLKKYNLTEDQFCGKEKIEGDLDMSSYTGHAFPAGFNPTVGGSWDMKSGTKYIGATVPPVSINKNFFWDVKEKRYAKIDGIFCEILSTHEYNKENTYTIYTGRKIGKSESFHIVGKDGFYAHGTELKKAFEDLQFKIISEKIKKDPIYPDTEFTVMRYRTLTGACDMGCRNWMDKHKVPYTVIDNSSVEKAPIKAKDLLPMIKGEYGYERFKQLITF